MEILNTDRLKENIVQKIEESKIAHKLIIISMNPSKEEESYKNFIIKKCKKFGVPFIDRQFPENTDPSEIVEYINSFDCLDGFLILLPFDNYGSLNKLKEEIRIKDLDGFTYLSQGKALNGDINYLPATPKAIARYLESITNLRGLNIIIANNTNLIGLPLATYLSSKGASVSIINKSTQNPKDYIKNSDIFISAIGKANYYTKEYFKDGQILIDVGTSVVNGMIVGDINYEDIKDLDVKILTNKRGIGALTTLILIESLIN